MPEGGRDIEKEVRVDGKQKGLLKEDGVKGEAQHKEQEHL